MFQHAADLEKRQNEEEAENMVGQEVTYGSIIQVTNRTFQYFRTLGNLKVPKFKVSSKG